MNCSRRESARIYRRFFHVRVWQRELFRPYRGLLHVATARNRMSTELCGTTTGLSSEQRILKLLQASPEQQAAVDRILEGRPAPQSEEPQTPKGPLLMMVRDAAGLLGVHRTTIWRLVKAGRLETVELLGSLRPRANLSRWLPLADPLALFQRTANFQAVARMGTQEEKCILPRIYWGKMHLRETEIGTPAAIRTRDPLLRRQMLYPTELRARPNKYG